MDQAETLAHCKKKKNGHFFFKYRNHQEPMKYNVKKVL